MAPYRAANVLGRVHQSPMCPRNLRRRRRLRRRNQRASRRPEVPYRKSPLPGPRQPPAPADSAQRTSRMHRGRPPGAPFLASFARSGDFELFHAPPKIRYISPDMPPDRRTFLKTAGAAAASLLTPPRFLAQTEADYTLTIATKPLEIAPKRILSVTTYNGQFPGPLLRLKEGQPVTVDIRNDTDIPEQLHWHGQLVSPGVDGAAEEGTPFIPPRGARRISFVPKPSGFRFYHTHVRAGADLTLGQYSGL